MLSSSNRRRIAWVATFAILLNAFAPAVSHALAARLGVTWLEICTPDGLKRIAVEARALRPDIPPAAHVAANDNHCAYCAPHGATFAHAPPAAHVARLLGGAEILVTQLRTALPQLFPWSSKHSRAPPALS